MAEHYIGTMSGTSLDGVDAVLVDFAPAEPERLQQVLAHAHEPFDATLRAALLALNQSGPDELHRSAQATQALAQAHRRAVERALTSAGLGPADVRAIGVHGQTVRHRPDLPHGQGYTVQLDPSPHLGEALGLDTVSDFRSQDVAAGGQGAPLVPAYHRALFARAGEAVAVLNLGGMANLSLLEASGAVTGYDTGPGNVLMDAWMQARLGEDCDRDGRLAASGGVDEGLLAALLAEPFFALTPPKSTGRDLFSMAWLRARAGPELDRIAAAGASGDADAMATLAELTARTVADALGPCAARTLWVCGGGAFNTELMRRLQQRLAAMRVRSTAEVGLPPDQVEACAFAWLARERLAGRPTTLAAVTGARGDRSTGAHRLGRSRG